MRVPSSEAQMLARELNMGDHIPLRPPSYPLDPQELECVPLDAHPFAVGDSSDVSINLQVWFANMPCVSQLSGT
jgi:hypothetical protein